MGVKENRRRQRSQDEPDTDYADLLPLFEELGGLAEEDPARARLREELVTRCLPVAEHIARRFSGRGEAHEDLLQVARLGLIYAVDRFDVSKGSDFLPFAVPTIMGEVRRHFRDLGWSTHVPRRLKELHLSLQQAGSELAQRLGRAPTPSELATVLNLSREEVAEGLLAGNAYRTVSTDQTVNDDSDTMMLGDTLGEDDTELDGVEYHEALKPLLAELPERERRIVMLRFFGNMTQTQVAERVGISQMHVSRLLARTLTQLRAKLMETP
jgi:RNA polymerase sigma-B factor